MFTSLKKPLKRSSPMNSSWVSGQDRKKKPPAYGTKQIAGFGEFNPFTNLGKKQILIII